jgi:hypothetical protein
LLNLRYFKSEALVFGNCAASCFEDEAEGGPVADEGVWVVPAVSPGFSFVNLFLDEAPEAPLMRRFLRGRWLSVLSVIGNPVDAEVDGVD